MPFNVELSIAALPKKVFDFVSDFNTMSQWYSAIQRVKRIHGSGGVGTRYLVYRDLPGGRVENEVEISSMIDGKEVTFTSRRGPTPFIYRYLVESDGAGTHLILNGTISGDGLTGPLALLAPMAERLFKNGMRKNLDRLRQLLENEQ